MLMCEELLLLLVNDAGKPEQFALPIEVGMSAAAVADLVALGRVELVGDKNPKVVVTNPTPTGHAALDGSLRRLAHKSGRRLEWAVADSKVNPTRAVAEQLAADDVIEYRESSWLGLQPARYPTRDPGPEFELRRRLSAILGGEPADVHDATLLAIIDGLGVSGAVFPTERTHLGKREMKRRIAELAAGIPEGRAVEATLTAIAAMVAATAAASVVSS